MIDKPLIVILTDEHDAHVQYVTPHLSFRHIVVDPQRMLKGTELSYANENGQLRVTYDGTVLDNVAAVWYRKPQDFERDDIPVASDHKHYAHSALQEHWHTIRSLFQDAYWLSDYYQLKKADSKPWQLLLASQAGFKVPRSLMTSSPEAAKQFIDSCDTVIVKSLARYSVSVDDSKGQPKAFFATKLKSSDPQALAGLHLAPAIFQQAVDADIDIRVHVIGDKVIAASIGGSEVDNPASPVRDWKVAHYKGDMQIKAFTLPASISKACIAHTKMLGLEFGVIDLVIDKQGDYWFLENNPNGQWAFVEDETNQPIGKTIAELLNKRAKTSA